MSVRRIESEEVFERSRTWLIKRSIELEDPLLDPDKKAKLRRAYDITFDALQRYTRGQLVREYPGLREKYKMLGWAYDEPEPEREQGEASDPVSSSHAPSDTSSYQTKPAAALASWLDDD